MRIVIDLQGAQSSGSRNRGIGRYTLSLAQAIIRNKGSHEVLIVLNGLFHDTIEPIRALFDQQLPQENIRVWHAVGPVSHIDPANNWRRKTAELSREAFLATLSPDILYVTSLFEGLTDDAVTSIGLLTQTIPTAVTLYDLIPLINRSPYLDNLVVESWYENKLDQIRRSSLLLAISESSRQEGIDYLGFPIERSINVGTAADPQFKYINISSVIERDVRERYGLLKPFIMYTGGIDHRKNIEGLIRAYALLPQSLRMKHQLAIVCSVHDDTRRILADLAAKQGLAADELILTGFVPENDLIALYHLCKSFIFPSWHEGFGLPALEAMCCGAAVIAANTSSLPEVVGREDALFNPHVDRAIAQKIQQVLTDDAYREELIQHGLAQAKKFSWDESAKLAIGAFEKFHAENLRNQPTFSQPISRPKLAYVSPLPPERTGIADYSAELLLELARHYDIDVIVAQETVTDPWIKENCSVRTVLWFSSHGHLYDRVLYHFGNSPYHQHMFDLLAPIPGVVVLHDFFLSGIIHHMDAHGFSPNCWTRELYHSHGYKAVQERYDAKDIADVVWHYPCNKTVLENAQGVIVHSESSRRLASQWLGETFPKDWSVIPLLRTPAVADGRSKARLALGLDEDVFLVCSFGLLSPNKLNRRLLDAWLASPLSKDKRCYLVFVGENHAGDYGAELTATIRNNDLSNRIRITGWTDTAQFRQYLAAADVGVQLRTLSRGETSAAVLDCMNYGLPTIVNANGSMADLPEDAVYMLPDEFDDVDLTSALETLWKDEKNRHAIGALAREVVHTQHAPRTCADRYTQAIERYYKQEKIGTASLINAIGKIEDKLINENEWLSLSLSIDRNDQWPAKKQLLLDISVLVQSDAKSGIQRVVRSILSELLENPPKGFRVEPVYAYPDGPYRYARQFTLGFMGCPTTALVDDPINVANGDVYLCLDLTHHIALAQVDFYAYMRRVGVQVNFIIYDLLPILMPHRFPDGVHTLHARWLDMLARTDGVLCISRAVADEMAEWLNVFGPARLRPLKIGWFHLGADVAESVPTKGLPVDVEHVLKTISRRPTFLSVGTIEPRKGQQQTLAAFERLWNKGVDVNLVFVGKHGWNVDQLIDALSSHSERDRRLFWLDGISDEYLEEVYAASTCLIAASEGEGFGLPLIEAAQHKLPIIARDIPVFREVAAEHAFYFSGLTPDALADGVRKWLALDKAGQAPQSDTMPWLTWKQSTQNLLDVTLGDQWYRQWMPDDVRRFWGADSRLGTQVGKRTGRDIVSTGQAGYLLFGPYIPLAAGQYRVVIRGALGKNGASGARMDVVVDKGDLILGESVLSESDKDGCLAALLLSLNAPCTDLEVRVWVSAKTDLHVSMIEIAPWQGEQKSSSIDSENIARVDSPDRDAVLIKPEGQKQSSQVISFVPRAKEPTQDFAEVKAELSQRELIGSSALLQPAHSNPSDKSRHRNE
ncbi:glycosyltransferase [Acidovorax sp. BoFeN1]|uniref:glycosyltransferase n=1 Tax=Acidovorax sp. BoFeN1 TaxID=1231053 RepID=UPI000E08EA51|nr:glycosyltransferase [Acidovorax sp. BoFeN1]RDD92241.1 glycosyltransferase [Acidovorax sp. BoFeN1]